MDEHIPPAPAAEPDNRKGKPQKPVKAKKDPEFQAKYSETKERDMQSLALEIEERNSRDTKKKRRNWWIKTVLMLVLIAGSVAIMFTMNSYLAADGTKSLTQMVQEASLPWFSIFLGVLLLGIVVESMKYAYLLKIQTGKFHFRIAIKTMFLGRYYDGITPFGTGGQPFQIYYMHKKAIPAGVATSIPLVRYIVSTIVFCLAAVAMLVLTSVLGLLEGYEQTILIVAAVALAFNFFVPVAMIFASIFPRMGKKLIVGIVNLLSKIRIVKHKYPTIKKYVYEVEEYRQSLRATFGAWWKPLPLILLCLMDVTLYMALPFTAVLAIAGNQITNPLPRLFLEIGCLSFVSFYSASLVPTPGNSVASEAVTTLAFLTVSGIGNVIGWVVLLWRLANFYVFILSGIGINIFEVIRSAIRNRRLLHGGAPPPEIAESPPPDPTDGSNTVESSDGSVEELQDAVDGLGGSDSNK